MYATVGIHPECAKDVEGDYLSQLEELANHKR